MLCKIKYIALFLIIGVNCQLVFALQNESPVAAQRLNDSDVKPSLKSHNSTSIFKKDPNVFHQADIKDVETGEIIVPNHFYSPRNLPKIKRKFYRLKAFKKLKLTCNATFPVEWQKMEVGDGDIQVSDFKNYRPPPRTFSSVTLIAMDDFEDTDNGYSYAVYHCVGKRANKKSKITMRLYVFKK